MKLLAANAAGKKLTNIFEPGESQICVMEIIFEKKRNKKNHFINL